MNCNILNKNKVKQIRQLLPYGSITKIHGKTGHSIWYVSRVLNGYEYNEKIIKAAIEIIKGSLKLNEELNDILKQTA
ncbi:hypothetical protein ES708_10590 [subsurface metagenome]